MLSISPPMKGAGKGDYYLGLAKEDYYTKGGEPPGNWYGRGTEHLGLSGQVKEQDLRQLLEGYSPKDGTALVQNAGDPDRQSGWDLTFSAPKPVSTIWAVGDEHTQKLILEAHRKAVTSALDYIQDEAGFTRRGAGGVEIERADLAFAIFEHGTSRAQDPQIHSHALLMNAGIREDGTTGTVISHPVFEQKMAAGAIYRVELAHQLEQNLNLECVREKSSFKIEGSSKELESDFSKRRKEIEKALHEGGYSGAVASKVAALNTRSVKEHIPREVLFEEWKKIGQAHGVGPEQINKLTEREVVKRDVQNELTQTLNFATESISDKESYFTKSSFVRYSAEEAQGRGLSSATLRDGIDSYLAQSQNIVFLGEKDGKHFYTTKEILDLEKNIIDTSRKRSEEKSEVSASAINSALDSRPTLDKEQRDAVKKLTQDAGATQIATGFAGTGKSFMLEAVRDAFEKEGYSVYGAAPSGVAAQGLEESTGIKSNTIHKTFSLIENGELELNGRSVLVVDEAGMVGTKLMSRLFEEADKSGAKIILTGDERQIQSVQAGGALKTLKEEIGFSELTQIRRQREDWAKEAVKSFAEGDADKALKAYSSKGLVTVAENSEEARDALIKNWRKEGIERPESNIIIATTNLDVSILNEKAQAVRFSEGKLTGDGISHNGKTFFNGDRILMTKNSEKFGVKNGNIGTIKEVDSSRKTIKTELDSGKIVTLDLNKYDQVSLGYAVTAHKSQGATYDNAHLFISTHDKKEIAYVKASRVKDKAHFYMDKETAGENLAKVSSQMQKSQMKELATTLSGKLENLQTQNKGITLA